MYEEEMPGRVNIFENTANTPRHEHNQHLFKPGIACWLEKLLGISIENDISSSHTLPLPPSASPVSAEQRGN
jgi:hypothetical protein